MKLTEKKIWQAIESTGIAYENWIAYKDAENLSLNIGIELKVDDNRNEREVATLIYDELIQSNDTKSNESTEYSDLMDTADFRIKVDFLPKGTFANYISLKQSEGADLAHLKPPHINPSDKILSIITAESEETIVVTKSGVKTDERSDTDKIVIS